MSICRSMSHTFLSYIIVKVRENIWFFISTSIWDRCWNVVRHILHKFIIHCQLSAYYLCCQYNFNSNIDVRTSALHLDDCPLPPLSAWNTIEYILQLNQMIAQGPSRISIITRPSFGLTQPYHIYHITHGAEYVSVDTYRQTFNISRTIVGNKIVNHLGVVGVSTVGADPTTSSFST